VCDVCDGELYYELADGNVPLHCTSTDVGPLTPTDKDLVPVLEVPCGR
jgi:hypothetical protein